VSGKKLQVLLCPSDTNDPTWDKSRQARHNYPINEGNHRAHVTGWQKNGYNYATGHYWFEDWGGNKPVRLRDITDGTTHTAMFSEWVTGNNSSAYEVRASVLGSWIDPNGPQDDSNATRMINECEAVNEKTTWSWPNKGEWWVYGGGGRGGYVHLQTPNRKQCFAGWHENGEHMITASSYHPGGVNMLMGDGSVRFVGDNVDRKIWWALGSRDGGERISNTDF
jgi:prepilin-type processing-associated H-X9-DG protein